MLKIFYQIQNRKTGWFEFAFTDKDAMTPTVKSMNGFVKCSRGILLSEEK